MPQDWPGFLILAPYRSHLEIVKFPTSRVVKANCGHFAWVSQSGEPHLTECYTVCEDCAEEIMNDPTADKRTTPGALDEIARNHGARVAREVEKHMRRRGIDPGGSFRRQ